MAVVVNEFEVIPEPQAAPAGAAREEPGRSGRPKDPEHELERQLHKRRTRALRLMAV